ncbi:MAG: ADP-ribosylglycohydrolase family protein [Chloroflexi bacterium]|nr:ADP-ribosylglycohydrolase family protein [Chloroflexota bacterium]
MTTLTFDQYYQKVLGGWNGKCIGGTVGMRGEAYKGQMEYDFARLKPDEVIPNDDLDVSIMWLHTMERRGIHVSSPDLVDAWMEHCYFSMCEFGFFKQSVRRGLHPPLTGLYNNGYFNESGGAPMRPELWAFICPGNPDLAAAYAGQDGCIDHTGDAVLIQQFYAALLATAFVEPSLDRAVARAMHILPAESRPARTARFAIELHGQHADYRVARRLMLRRFGHTDPTKAVINLGLVMIGLLYGGGDFATSQIITNNCGYDTDTTCGTVGAILGVLSGDQAIPQEWKAIISGEFSMRFPLPRSHTMADLTRETCRAGVTVAEVLKRQVEIVGVPDDLGRLPTTLPARPATIEVSYPDKIALGVGESTTIDLTVRYHQSTPFAGSLGIAAPDHLTVTPSSIAVRFEGPGERRFALRVSMAEGLTEIDDVNLLTATLAGTGAADVVRTFGIVGAIPFAVFGPFWDPYDRAQPTKPTLENNYVPRSEMLFNSFADMGHAYLDEERLAQGLALDDPALETDDPIDPPGLLYARENFISLDRLFGYEGSAIFYVVWDFVSPEEVDAQLMVAGRDPHRVWVNGEPRVTSDRFQDWAPNNRRRPLVRLRQGRNRFVAKLYRLENATEFSFHFRYPNQPSYGVNRDNILTNLTSIVPTGLEVLD